MVFVFGVDVPLVELLLVLTVVAFFIFIEATVVLVIMLYQMKHSKEILKRLEKKLGSLSKVKKKERFKKLREKIKKTKSKVKKSLRKKF